MCGKCVDSVREVCVCVREVAGECVQKQVGMAKNGRLVNLCGGCKVAKRLDCDRWLQSAECLPLHHEVNYICPLVAFLLELFWLARQASAGA